MKAHHWVLLAYSLSGCSGVQGGQGNEDLDHCVYDSAPLSDPDAIAEGFAKSPRELFANVTAHFSGTLSNGRAVRLEVQPDYAELHASYAQGDGADCEPGLSTNAVFSLNVDGAADDTPQIVDDASLGLRSGSAFLSARFEASPGTPLAAVVPRFSREPVLPPSLDVWVTGLESQRADSQWRWSAFVACQSGETCAGGPAPGATVPTTGVELSWGAALLTRNPP